MIDAVRPVVNDTAHLDYALAEVDKAAGSALASDMREEVLELYSEYEQRLFGVYDLVPHTWPSSAHHDALRATYSLLTRKYFGTFKKDIRSAAPFRKCAYCYQNEAGQVDHYLPKAIFGEYSIFSANLVPICSRCNEVKSNRYETNDGNGLRYIHAYFDNLPLQQNFLVAKIEITESVLVSYHLVKTSGFSDQLWVALQNQFADLHLADRYSEDAVEMMQSTLGSLYDVWRPKKSAHDIQTYLLSEKKSKQNAYGINHWWPVLLGALATSPPFCQGGFTVLGPDPGM